MSATPTDERLVLVDASGGADWIVSALRGSLASAGAAPRVLAIPLGGEEEVERCFDDVLEATGGLDRLVVAVDLSRADQALIGTSAQAWACLLEACLRAPFLVLRRALQELLAGGRGGRVLFLVATPRRATHGALLSALEAGLVSLVRSAAAEYGRRAIACNALLFSGDGRDVLEPVLFLASDEATFVNGEPVDLRAAVAAGPAPSG
jgi:NAD(P)-dependent dehydrogenase (short-subunit alcohol dehydrogenase family)